MTTEPNWDLYRSFLAVMGEGSLSAAARALGLTQPTVGRHIETLEQALALSLFTRSQAGLIATDDARALRPHAQAVASASTSLLRAASSLGAAPGKFAERCGSPPARSSAWRCCRRYWRA